MKETGTGRWVAWAALSMMAVGCATVLGIDKDYHPVGGGGGPGSGQGGGPGSGQGGGGASGPGSGPGGGQGGGQGGVCKPESKQCAGNVPQTCDEEGQWQSGAACSAPAEVCSAGACVAQPSCAGLAETCGAMGFENCCAASAVPGGTYNRSNDALYPATVGDFQLDRFEITVGRFRAFVNAYPTSKPLAGAGKHPKIAGSGWDAAWDTNLPMNKAALVYAVKCTSYTTWTDTAGANDNRPMNCLTWYDAFAFCAWDGGRLPTEAEWNYAAAGGSEQREYPWGSAAPDSNHAVYNVTSPVVVGSKAAGDGKWKQADLAGSMFEWNLDGYVTPYAELTCNDCAHLQDIANRGARGGSWVSNELAFMLSSYRGSAEATVRSANFGARCARTP